MEPALLTKMEGVKTSGTDCRRYKVLPKVWKCAQPEIRVEDSRYFQTFQEKLRDHRAGLEWGVGGWGWGLITKVNILNIISSGRRWVLIQ